MSEKWLISHCEGYGVRIDEQALVIARCTQDKRPRKWGGGAYGFETEAMGRS